MHGLRCLSIDICLPGMSTSLGSALGLASVREGLLRRFLSSVKVGWIQEPHGDASSNM